MLNIKKVNAHAVKINRPSPPLGYTGNVYLTIPASNIGLNQRAEDPETPWDTYFEFSVYVDGNIFHYQAAYNEPEGYWELSMWDSFRRCGSCSANEVHTIPTDAQFYLRLERMNSNGIFLGSPGRVFEEVFAKHGTYSVCPNGTGTHPLTRPEANKIAMRYGRV
jgi:hypothetical protein